MASTLVHGNPASPSDVGQARSEFQALLSGCGFYDLSSRVKIALTGGDRVRWLNGMVTNNIRDLATGRGLYAFLLNPQGHILGDLYAYNRGESVLIDRQRSVPVRKAAGHFRSLHHHGRCRGRKRERQADCHRDCGTEVARGPARGWI
jgi:glycine cleavage system aminomethyltransferase T